MRRNNQTHSPGLGWECTMGFFKNTYVFLILKVNNLTDIWKSTFKPTNLICFSSAHIYSCNRLNLVL